MERWKVRESVCAVELFIEMERWKVRESVRAVELLIWMCSITDRLSTDFTTNCNNRKPHFLNVIGGKAVA